MQKILLVMGFISCFFSVIYSDGFHISAYQEHMREPSQKAVIFWDGKMEKMIISSAVVSDDIQKFAWIVPILSKTKPVVNAGDFEVINEAVKYFFSEADENWSWFGVRSKVSPESSGIVVLETKQIDIYDIAVIQGQDSADLLTWMKTNGFRIPSDTKAMLDKYIKKGNCYFVVNRIDLRNKYNEEITENINLYKTTLKNYDEQMKELNLILKSAGMPEFHGKQYRFWREGGPLLLMQNYMNGRQNPVDLPFDEENFGNGLTVRVRPAVILNLYGRQDGKGSELFVHCHQKLMTVYRNGKYVDVINLKDGAKYNSNYIIDDADKVIAEINKRGLFTTAEVETLENWVKLNVTEGNSYINGDRLGNAERLANKFMNRLDDDSLNKVRESMLTNSLLFQTYRNNFLENRKKSDVGVFSSSGAEDDEQVQVKLIDEKNPLKDIPEVDMIESAQYMKMMNADEAARKKHGELLETIRNVKRGFGTPLQFEFEPEAPWYPMEISSLNSGKANVEVYLLGKETLIDNNRVLTFDTKKDVVWGLSGKLKDFVGHAEVTRITRFFYNADFSGLKEDAVFVKEETTQ